MPTRLLALLGTCLLVPALSACGGSGETGGSAAAATETAAKPPPRPRGPTVMMSKAEIAKLPPLKIPPPSGPPPHRLEIVDLREGSGPGVPKHDWVTNREEMFMHYVQASYPQARKGQMEGPFSVQNYLLEGASRGLAMGLTGMKVGGRRELILPPWLVYPRWKRSWGYVPYVTVYVIDLVGMEPPPDRRVEYRNRPFGGSS